MRAATFLIALVLFAAAFRPVPVADGSYTAVIAQRSVKGFVRAGEFIGRAESQPSTSNTSALEPFVCQHDLVVERIDIWAQVFGSYGAEVWMAARDSYTAPPSYSATSMSVSVPTTSNIAATEDNPVYCRKGDFLLIRIDADVNPEYISVSARIRGWNP